MSVHTIERRTRGNCLDIASAASKVGYSPRHFRKIIEEDGIPVMQIGRKYYIMREDLEAWKSARGRARLEQSIHQVDGWMQQTVNGLVGPEPEDEQG
jgi:excisionase family DNA binding protein